MALEYLQIAEMVAREKDIEKEQVLEVMEQAIQMAARKKLAAELNLQPLELTVQAHIDRVSGEVHIKRLTQVVKMVMEVLSPEEARAAVREGREPEMRPACDKRGYPLKSNPSQILLAEAQKVNPNIQIGEYLMEELPAKYFDGRVAAQAAKQVIFQKVKDVERAKELEVYKDAVGTIISGIIKRADFNGALIDLGRAEAWLPKDETIQRETFKQGDRIRAYIYKVNPQARGPQIFVSRTHPQYLVELFKEQVPEIQNGTIEVMGAARDPGFRAKIAVKSYDRNLDPVGACVGIRGVRVQAVTTELQGERVDIIEWSPNAAEFLVRAMQPAQVSKVVLDEDDNRIEVVVPQDNLSLAIGRRGQNVRLASILTGWDIDVMTDAEESERRTNEYNVLSSNLMQNLDVDDVLARLLIAEGFRSIDDLLKVGAEEIATIEGLDIGIAQELQNRAQTAINAAAERLAKLGVSDELKAMPGMTADLIMALGEQGIKTLDDLGDLATDELQEMLPAGLLNDKQAQKLIMAARQHWFAEEDEEEDDVDAAPAEAKASDAAQA
ncbi:MAG: transcription termination/antitermination protein NusA [Blastochloris viridis]|uniref:Transcription termination/antitermination protein NusA n=1 Tax=Blastochloris viridis TaxID=1079 RepID=A0A6N4RDZ6_BLAVI|nr:MAG: transcription termination/antitermination protein NusA [Blastochloris viridis]